MKKQILYVISVYIFIFAAGCSSRTTPEYVPEGPERDAIIADTDIFARNIQEGMEKDDFELFSSNFDETMKSSITQEKFEVIKKQYESYFPSKSMELVNVQVTGEYFAVRYKVTYEKKVVIMRVVVNNQSPREVSGLWFE